MAKDISTISQNPATIGKSATLVISAYDSTYTHRVTYTIGSIESTMIFQGVTGGSYVWVIPTSFYDELPEDAVSMEGTLACDTYSQTTGYVGTSYCQFVVHAGEEAPTLSVSAFDTNEATVALTGDSNVLIPGFSNIHCEMDATANNGATIASVKIIGGSETVADYSADFVGARSYSYYFYATDSRGLTSKSTVILDDVTTNTVNYYRGLTCDMSNVSIETTGECSFTLSGNCWLQSFGKQTNTLTVQYRHREGDNAWGDWVTITVSRNDVYNSVTNRYEYTHYSKEITLTGLDYKQPQYIQARAIDLVQTVETEYDTVNAVPIFDWSRDDFNFNVPVKFSKGASGINCYGTCETAADTTAKVVESEDVFELVEGMSIRVKFTNEHFSAIQPTLNVNGTGAKAVLKGNLPTWYYAWGAGEVKDFVYDGTNWVMVGGIATTTGYGAAILTSEYDDDDTSKAVTGIAVKKAVADATSAFTTDVSNLKTRTTTLESKVTSLQNTKASTSTYGLTKLATTISSDDTTAATPGAVQDAISAVSAAIPSIEYGTWTPTLNVAVGSRSTAEGWYYKIGNIVTIGFYIYATNSTSVSSTAIEITGLPYSSNGLNYSGSGYLNGYNGSDLDYNFGGWSFSSFDTVVPHQLNSSMAGFIDKGLNYPSTGSYGGWVITASGTICYPIYE